MDNGEKAMKNLDEKKWYQFNDGWFTYYVNTVTGEKKMELEKGDIEVNALDYLDDFGREDCNSCLGMMGR